MVRALDVYKFFPVGWDALFDQRGTMASQEATTPRNGVALC